MNLFKTTATLVLVVGCLTGGAHAADLWYNWIGGVGDYFDGNNWLGEFGANQVPPGSDTPWINNGGTVNAVGAGGTLSNYTFHIGVADTLPVVDNGLPGTGTLNLTDLSLSAGNGQLRVGFNNGEARSVNGTLSVTNGSIHVSSGVLRFEVGVVLGDIDGNTATGRVSADGSVSGHSGGDTVLRIGEYNNSGAGPSADAHADGALTAGTGLLFWQAINVGVYNNTSVGGSGSATGELTVSAGGVSGTNTGNATLTVGSATGANATATATADITGDFVSTGLHDFAALNIGLADGDATTQVNASVTLRGSDANIDNVTIGKRANGTENVSASLVLNPSLLTTDLLDLGDAGSLTFHLAGLARVTVGTVGDASTYAAADAVDAVLAGQIIADFDFTPTPGTHVFDLIVTDSLTALNDTTMVPGDFQVVGLHGGFSVDSFGVVEDGTDIVRLQISGVPEPTSLALLGLGGAVVFIRRRCGVRERAR